MLPLHVALGAQSTVSASCLMEDARDVLTTLIANYRWKFAGSAILCPGYEDRLELAYCEIRSARLQGTLGAGAVIGSI